MRIIALIPALVLAGCATAAGSTSDRAQARLSEALAGMTAGEPRNCVPQDRLEGPDIIDNRTILYRESGRRIWRNDLPAECPVLRPDRILIVELYGGNMCRNDLFSVLDRNAASFPYGKCRLGAFTPYEKPRK